MLAIRIWTRFCLAAAALLIALGAVHAAEQQRSADGTAFDNEIQLTQADLDMTPAVPDPEDDGDDDSPPEDPGYTETPAPADPTRSQPLLSYPSNHPRRAGQPGPGLFALLLGGGRVATPASRLAGVPNMFGDTLGVQSDMLFEISTGENFEGSAEAALPLAGTSRRAKVAEHNTALPGDRVLFGYNHFANALSFSATGLPGTPSFGGRSLDRFTLGIEKTFCGNRYSIELRSPLAGYQDVEREFFGITGGAGNLSIIFKRLLTRTCNTATVIGLAVDVPTGSDVHGFADLVNYHVSNEAVFLSPFVGGAWMPSDRVFHQVFVQIDVPTGGDSVDVFDTLARSRAHLGELHSQTALYVDVQTGWWLYRNPCARGLTGLAALIEFHYSTTTTDADALGYITELGTTTVNFTSPTNRVDLANLTFGMHAELDRTTTFRVGAVVPLREDDNRAFDSEIVVQAERRF